MLLTLAFLGGVLTILSPCILPVIPLVFSRAGRANWIETASLLVGLGIAFTVAALVATATAHWLLIANEVTRYVSLALLGLVGATLMSTRTAELVSRPVTRLGAALLSRRDERSAAPIRNVVVGMAIGMLWAPCAGPILGLLLAAASADTARAAPLFLTFALGAIMSLAVVMSLGSRLLTRIKRAGAADVVVRRFLGAATIVTVVAIFFGWDRAIFAKGGLVQTARAEEVLVNHLAPHSAVRPDVGLSLDAFAAAEDAHRSRISLQSLDGTLPGFDGGTEWINSPMLTPEALHGKVVLVEFWTFGCYNCLNALPHVKDLYAKYKNRGFVVVGVHTPEFAHERLPENVRNEVKKLGIEFPVVIDNENRIWKAFHNQYWPAMYYADATGKLRFYHFGEGRYEDQDRVVATLLAERDGAATRGDH